MDTDESVTDQIARGNAADELARLVMHLRLSVAEIDAIADVVKSEPTRDLLAVARAMPRGMAALVRVIKEGAKKHNGGDLGIAPGVTAVYCAEHLQSHAADAWYNASWRDPETKELDAAHAAARGVMVVELVERDEVRR